MTIPAPELAERRPLDKAIKNARVPLDPNGFRNLLFAEGLRVGWEMAMRCPCSQTDDGLDLGLGLLVNPQTLHSRGRSDCPACAGKGYLHRAPREIQAIFTTAQKTPLPYSPQGEVVRGEARFSMLPEHLPGRMDRLTLLDASIRVEELAVRSGDIQRLRYPIALRRLDLEGGAVERGVLAVLGTDATGLPQDELLVEGADYLITQDGGLDLRPGDATGRSPAAGQRMSVTYYAHPVYVVQDIPHSTRDRWDQAKKVLPAHFPELVQARARLEFLGDGGAYAGV